MTFISCAEIDDRKRPRPLPLILVLLAVFGVVCGQTPEEFLAGALDRLEDFSFVWIDEAALGDHLFEMDARRHIYDKKGRLKTSYLFSTKRVVAPRPAELTVIEKRFNEKGDLISQRTHEPGVNAISTYAGQWWADGLRPQDYFSFLHIDFDRIETLGDRETCIYRFRGFDGKNEVTDPQLLIRLENDKWLKLAFRLQQSVEGELWFDREDQALVRMRGSFRKTFDSVKAFLHSNLYLKGSRWDWRKVQVGDRWVPREWRLWARDSGGLTPWKRSHHETVHEYFSFAPLPDRFLSTTDFYQQAGIGTRPNP